MPQALDAHEPAGHAAGCWAVMQDAAAALLESLLATVPESDLLVSGKVKGDRVRWVAVAPYSSRCCYLHYITLYYNHFTSTEPTGLMGYCTSVL